MSIIKANQVINRPVSEVFDYMLNFNDVPIWQSNVLEARLTTLGPVGVGSEIRWVQKFLGKRFESTLKVVEYKQNEMVRFKSISGPIDIDGAYTFESVEGGTKLTQSTQGELHGIFKVADSIGTNMYRRQVSANFKNLKDSLEAKERVTAQT